ncbi:hypothetical protein [Alloyangia pacifica]|uniref:Uncharacterized protein n=1 Tax=Alloyangia pacifica TaxID=311180 RepID=A0A1I6VSR4_9RHOB|nr:hypothetical protein [Alloyangia pacifica]SDI13267.1 hypothetical protein SAMN04488245_112211 [Alloyangia pacifica]SFT16738.1 hypothetical protein SAMN04488050_112211 [Alloyangia pacifica]
MLTISSDTNLVERQFDTWRSALLEEGIRDGNLWRLPEQCIVFRNQTDAKSDTLGPGTALGTDPTGVYWAVQINEARKPGDPNVTSAIALDEKNRPFLLRQGRLARQKVGDKHILEAEFRALTGLSPEDVENGDTPGKKREWYIVTPLDVSPDEIRSATGRFVDICAKARGKEAAGEGLLPDTTPAVGLGNDETGGTYTVGARDAQDAKQILKQQGEVWQRLVVTLREAGIAISKPKHANGYEVDAVIAGPIETILLEIKSGATAADVYTGMGQLQLYPKLLPQLGHHQLVLLLPKLPQQALVKAVEECGVRLCTYDFFEESGKMRVTFSDELREICGIKPPHQKR